MKKLIKILIIFFIISKVVGCTSNTVKNYKQSKVLLKKTLEINDYKEVDYINKLKEGL